MECFECKKLLSLFLDGQIDQKQQEQMKNHLKECADCAQVLESLTKMINLMRGMKEVEPAPDFTQKVNNRLDRQGFWEKVETNIKIFWQTKGPVRAAAVLATVVLAVYASIEVSKLDLGSWKKDDLSKSCSKKSESPHELKKGDTFKYESKTKLDTSLSKKRELKDSGQADVLDKVQLDERIRPRESAEVYKKSADIKLQFSPEAPGAKLAEEEITFAKDNFNGMVIPEKSSLESRPKDKEMNIPVQVQIKTETHNEAVYKEKKEPLTRTDVLIIKQGNLIALYRDQKWALSCQDLEEAKQELIKLLSEFKAEGVKVEEIQKDGNLIFVFSGTIRYRQVPLLISRVEQLGKVNMLTPLPVVRPEVYTSARGGINPLVLEELISVEISLSL